MDKDEVLAVIEASPPRRWLGIGMLAALGVLVLSVAVARPPEPVWQVILIVIGAGALWLADRMRRATERRIELTATELRDSAGTRLARVDEIARVDRGTFAFKPSNGFILHLTKGAGRAWQPGLWWRVGRRVGVGGVTPGAQTKFMSEVISALLEDPQLSNRT